LMSEFQEFDSSVCKSVSPKPMFSKPTTPRVEVHILLSFIFLAF
jgi:hypothetical protein